MLLIAEQTNELLLKNYYLRPTCSIVMHETHVGSNKSFRHFRGYGRRQGRGFRKGLSGHWSHTCRTSLHFVNLYQASLKQNGKKIESHSNTLDEINARLMMH